MAQDKEKEHATATSSPRKAAEAGDKKPTSIAGRGAPRASTRRAQEGGFAQRRQQYLIGVRSLGSPLAGFPAPSFPPQSVDAIVDYLKRQDGVEIITRIKPAGAQPFARNGAFAQEIVVARIAEDRAESLQAGAQPHIVIEPDGVLTAASGVAIPMRAAIGASAVVPLSPISGELELQIVDDRDQPLSRATVVVYGSGFPVQSVTDDSGTARLRLFGGQAESVKAICVKPAADYWERFIVAPELNASAATTIKLRPLTDTFPSFPNDRSARWDQRLMRLDPSADKLTGAGIRVAIIDSGCDNTHPCLRHVTRGKDLTNRGSDTSWTEDALGYGTCSAGLITAAASAGQGMVGCAPEAEVHVLKVFPGGRSSDLLAALDECIAREIDVVSLNVGCDESEVVALKLREARHHGVACIAAAGDLREAPPWFPTALLVGAVGMLRTFPPDSCHANAVVPELIGAEGVFPAAFTAVNPNVGVSAPGVAVLSTVPGGYAALDGTGAAASLVTGMATLILAHHPLFQGPMKARSEQRVDALFNLIRASAVPRFGDPLRGGAGVPDLQRVPGLYGVTAGARSTPTGVFEDSYGAGAIYGPAPATWAMPYLPAWPAAAPAWAPQDWALRRMPQVRGTGGLI